MSDSGSEEDLKRQVEELKAQLASEKAKSQSALRLQVSQKGAVSLYGIRRFPITFYKDEWETILGMDQEIRDFIAENADQLKGRG